MRFELGGRCRGVPAVRSQLAEPVQKVRHERGQPPTEWPRKNLQTEVVDMQHLRRVYAWGNGRELDPRNVMWATIGIDGVLPTTVSLPRPP